MISNSSQKPCEMEEKAEMECSQKTENLYRNCKFCQSLFCTCEENNCTVSTSSHLNPSEEMHNVNFTKDFLKESQNLKLSQKKNKLGFVRRLFRSISFPQPSETKWCRIRILSCFNSREKLSSHEDTQKLLLGT